MENMKRLFVILLIGMLKLNGFNVPFSVLNQSSSPSWGRIGGGFSILQAQTPIPLPVVKEAIKKNKDKPWQWGVEAGLDLSHFSASRELISRENRTGWFVGLKIKTRIPLPNLGLDAAVLYNQNELGFQQEEEYREKKMHMFVVPFNLRYNWKIDSNFILYLATGPQWNWLVDRERIGEIGKFEHSFFDWNIGAGLDLLRHVQFSFNYNIPLGRMGQINEVNLEGQTWNVRFAYFF